MKYVLSKTLSRFSSKSFMMASTSAVCRLKFSIEKAKTLSCLTPSSRHHSHAWVNECCYRQTFASTSDPSLWPSDGFFPSETACRRFPSIIIATCSGIGLVRRTLIMNLWNSVHSQAINARSIKEVYFISLIMP